MQSTNEEVSLIVKPISYKCNLQCDYCFFDSLPKEKFNTISSSVIEKVIREYLEYQNNNVFVWHGGEPLLAGIDFFKEIIEIQSRYNEGNKIVNYLQTNATLLNQKWVDFLKSHSFRVGVSVDGPRAINRIHRRYINGKDPYEDIVDGIKLLRESDIFPGSITVITKRNLEYLPEILNFLYFDLKFEYLAFNAYVPNVSIREIDLLNNNEYFYLLKTCFDFWYTQNDYNFGIRDIDEILAGILGFPVNSCGYSGRCHDFFTVDNKGVFQPCERLINKKEYIFGDIKTQSFSDIINSEARKEYKAYQLLGTPNKCNKCELFNNCHNGCTSFRTENSERQKQGINIYCESKKKIHTYIKSLLGNEIVEKLKNIDNLTLKEKI
jgi:uncharacterized protein